MDGDSRPPRINCVLVASGKYHDIDFARLQLLTLLGDDQRVRVRVFEDYTNLDAIRAADFIVTYTCDVIPSLEQQELLYDWVREGGRWYALHGTNSILRFMADGKIDSPNWAPLFMETLGSRFLSHPPIEPYLVRVAKLDHPLVSGIEPFHAKDELYLSDYVADLEVLLTADFAGPTPGFVHTDWPQGEHPVFYIRSLGKGAVLYLTLGHCRGHYDMQPLVDWWPEIDRGSWELPVFHDLLRRGIDWAKSAPRRGSERN